MYTLEENVIMFHNIYEINNYDYECLCLYTHYFENSICDFSTGKQRMSFILDGIVKE